MKRTVLKLAAVFLSTTAALAGCVVRADISQDSAADGTVTGVVINTAEISLGSVPVYDTTWAAAIPVDGAGADAAALCQVLAHANAIVSNLVAAESLGVVEDSDTILIPGDVGIGTLNAMGGRGVAWMEQKESDGGNASARCSEKIGTIRLIVVDVDGFGEPPPQDANLKALFTEATPSGLPTSETAGVLLQGAAANGHVGAVVTNEGFITLVGPGVKAASLCQLLAAANTLVTNVVLAENVAIAASDTTIAPVPPVNNEPAIAKGELEPVISEPLPYPPPGDATSECAVEIELIEIIVGEVDRLPES